MGHWSWVNKFASSKAQMRRQYHWIMCAAVAFKTTSLGSPLEWWLNVMQKKKNAAVSQFIFSPCSFYYVFPTNFYKTCQSLIHLWSVAKFSSHSSLQISLLISLKSIFSRNICIFIAECVLRNDVASKISDTILQKRNINILFEKMSEVANIIFLLRKAEH